MYFPQHEPSLDQDELHGRAAACVLGLALTIAGTAETLLFKIKKVIVVLFLDQIGLQAEAGTQTSPHELEHQFGIFFVFLIMHYIKL